MSGLGLALLSALLAPVPVDTGVWGLRLGATPAQVKAEFAPLGMTRAVRWTEAREGKVTVLRFRCPAEDRCFSAPGAADFSFIGGRLAQASLVIDPESAPPNTSAAQLVFEMEARAHLGVAAAVTALVGRRTRYYLQPAHTVVIAQDGRDTDVKLYLDALDPVGRAEAVAAGAPPQGLEKLVGGKAYAAGQVALGEKDWDLAVTAFNDAMTAKSASPLLVAQARLVLAMVLAARAQTRGPGAASKVDLARARGLAPELSKDLDALEARLKAPRPPPAPPQR